MANPSLFIGLWLLNQKTIYSTLIGIAAELLASVFAFNILVFVFPRFIPTPVIYTSLTSSMVVEGLTTAALVFGVIYISRFRSTLIKKLTSPLIVRFLLNCSSSFHQGIFLYPSHTTITSMQYTVLYSILYCYIAS